DLPRATSVRATERPDAPSEGIHRQHAISHAAINRDHAIRIARCAERNQQREEVLLRWMCTLGMRSLASIREQAPGVLSDHRLAHPPREFFRISRRGRCSRTNLVQVVRKAA